MRLGVNFNQKGQIVRALCALIQVDKLFLVSFTYRARHYMQMRYMRLLEEQWHEFGWER